MDRHPDQKKRASSELTRDHMGVEIDKKMAYLDRVVGDVLGRSKGTNGIDGLLDNCMSFLDDLSDGIADGDEREHSGLRIWRLEGLEAGESPTKEMQSQPQVADSPVADSPVADSPVADSPVADSPVADSPVADSPVADSPVADSPVADSPVADSPVADSPVADSPVADSPAADSQDDQKVAAAQYFIRRKEKVFGPVSHDVIKRNIASGKLKDSDKFSLKKDGPWISVKKIPAFSSLFKS